MQPFFPALDNLMTDTSRSFQERSFTVNGLEFVAKEWNTGAPKKVIALHGWLDNANSYDLLAPLLEDCHLVALDLAGHGKTNFRSEDAPYLIWSDVGEVIQVIDQLGWKEFVLMGHSRGAGISTILAGTFPDRVTHLVLLEGGVAWPMKAEEAPENLARAIELTKKLYGTKGSIFQSREAAINARVDGFTKVLPATAETLAQRSLLQEGEEFRWLADARLKAPSELRLSDAQVDAFLVNIKAPSLLVVGKDGIFANMDFSETHFKNIANLKVVELPGGHHLHMEGAEQNIANEIGTLTS